MLLRVRVVDVPGALWAVDAAAEKSHCQLGGMTGAIVEHEEERPGKYRNIQTLVEPHGVEGTDESCKENEDVTCLDCEEQACWRLENVF